MTPSSQTMLTSRSKEDSQPKDDLAEPGDSQEPRDGETPLPSPSPTATPQGPNPTPQPGVTPNPATPNPTPGPSPRLPPRSVIRIDWRLAPVPPVPIVEAQSVSVGDKLFLFGGFDSVTRKVFPTNRNYVVNLQTNQWSRIADFPVYVGAGRGGLTHAGVATDGQKIYFAGGYLINKTLNGLITGTNEAWAYVIATNSFERLPDLPLRRASGQMVYNAGVLYYFGGQNFAMTEDSTEVYALRLGESVWQKKSALPNGRLHLAAVALNGLVYAIGGQHDHGYDKNIRQNSVHVYNPATDQWRALAPLPQGLSHHSHSTIVVGDQIVVLGGQGVPATTNASYSFRPSENRWIKINALPTKLMSQSVGHFGSKLYMTGGHLGVSQKKSYIGTMVFKVGF